MAHHFFSGSLVLALTLTASASAAPLPVTAGLQLHLDASAITGLNPSDPVANWDDLSPADNDAVAGGSNQPLYMPAVANGLPAVRFDGSNDAMNTGSTMTIGSAFIVGRLHTGTTWGSTYHTFAGAIGTNNHLFIADGTTSTNLYFSGASLFPISSVLIDGNPGVDFAPLQQLKALYGFTTSPTTAAVCLGHDASGGQPGMIDLAEVIIYNQMLSEEDLNAVGFYLQDKYGLAGNFTAPAVPEPSTFALLAVSAITMAGFLRRRRA